MDNDEGYVAFVKSVRQKPKTSVWDVVPKVDRPVKALGQVRWFGRWRCYAFFPETGTVYERVCLRTIADFAEEETRKHRDLASAQRTVAKEAKAAYAEWQQ